MKNSEIVAKRIALQAGLAQSKAEQAEKDQRVFSLPPFPRNDPDGYTEWAVRSGAPLSNRVYTIRRK